MVRNIILALLCILLPVVAWAGEPAGEISKFEGKVSVYRGGAVRGESVNAGDLPFSVGDSIKTKRNSLAYITFVDGSKIVLKPNSSLSVIEISKLNVDEGTVLFEIKKRGRAKGLEITSATVTMGVKGTRFAVLNSQENVSILLKEGLLDIGSLTGSFKRYKQSLQDEMESLQKKMENDFKASREKMRQQFEDDKKAMLEGNYEVVANFFMKGGNAVTISGDEVRDSIIPEGMDKDFDLLDSF